MLVAAVTHLVKMNPNFQLEEGSFWNNYTIDSA